MNDLLEPIANYWLTCPESVIRAELIPSRAEAVLAWREFCLREAA